MKKSLVVNFIGGPGCGKSSMAANIFAELKWNKIDCELCTEFAKDLIWDSRHETFKDELYILAKQNHRLFRCNGKVDVIVTDRPLIMSVVYNDFYGNRELIGWNSAYRDIVIETFNQYENLNIILKRVKPFNPNGRNEDESQAKDLDRRFTKFMDVNGIPYHTFDGDETSVDAIIALIKSKL